MFSYIYFTFPFTLPTLFLAAFAYIAASPLITDKYDRKRQFAIWISLAILFFFGFTLGYALRFLLAIAMMVASRMRLTAKGPLKELQMIVVAIVIAMLFVGLR